MSRPSVSLEIRDYSAWLTLDRAEQRNTITPQVITQLGNHLERIEEDDRVRVICLTGAGERAFCSGMDLKLAAQGITGLGSVSQASGRDYLALLRRIMDFPKPFLARVNGDCTGGGLGLMMACDLIYATERARFGAPEARLGLFPLIMVPLIFRKASRLKALEMFYTAGLYSATEAEAMGLITRVLPAERFEGFIEETLGLITTKSPTAFRIGRPALNRAERMEIDPAMDYLAERLEVLLTSEDAAEGIRAFVEKRVPKWTGR
jgi:enoyl-CoA hydratase/carnithine racemase